jgi:hypothetical protein
LEVHEPRGLCERISSSASPCVSQVGGGHQHSDVIGWQQPKSVKRERAP